MGVTDEGRMTAKQADAFVRRWLRKNRARRGKLTASDVWTIADAAREKLPRGSQTLVYFGWTWHANTNPPRLSASLIPWPEVALSAAFRHFKAKAVRRLRRLGYQVLSRPLADGGIDFDKRVRSPKRLADEIAALERAFSRRRRPVRRR